MNTLLAVIAFAGPWVQSPDFPQPKQEAALNATLRLTFVTSEARGEGTAVRVGKLGPFVYYLTANHVVEKTSKVDLESYSGKSHPKAIRTIPAADIKDRWPEIDLAILRAYEPDPPGFLAISTTFTPVKYPFPVLTVGCTNGNDPELVCDQVTSQRRVKKPDGTIGRYWEAAKQPVVGRSGGPLVNVNGELIGICSGTNRDKGYYVYLDEIVDALKRSNYDLLLAQPAKPAQTAK
jgi:Trypsin-like peptidase domain